MGVSTEEPVRLRCGQCNRRTLDWLLLVDDQAQSLGARQPVRRGHNRMVSFAARTVVQTRFTYACHPRRCGAAPVYTAERVTHALQSAITDGRTEIVTGVDL